MSAHRLLVAALLAVLTVPAVGAQALRVNASAPRVLFAVTDSVKTDDGTHARITRTVTYDPVAGTYTDETVDADGATLSRDVRSTSVAAPTEAELDAARLLVARHPEVAPLIDAAGGEVHVEGGFPLVREAGHPCGPGGRCVTVDVFEVTPEAPARRIRYAVVDLRTLRVLDADADADADSNLAHPAARQQSRRQ
ncbi:hypothetical protein [Rubrivirga marina]|uniref:Uncharacterized protein n=1 Tax=Rubrivirga marina TaxID=1196024 RepID=A0A271J049_9BACT|nr:hypothetical protein [Rubrivirga marina]PAP76730.1 hypothetical protein BSZ37_09915 [Rubrivirga marina]